MKYIINCGEITKYPDGEFPQVGYFIKTKFYELKAQNR